MINEIDLKLTEEIKRLQTQLELELPGSDSYKVLCERLSDLYKMRNDSRRMITERMDKILCHVLGAVSIGGTLMFSHYWHKQGFLFEEKGSLTSNTFRDIRASRPKLSFFKR